MSSTHIACLRILLVSTRDDTSRKKNVKRDRRLQVENNLELSQHHFKIILTSFQNML